MRGSLAGRLAGVQLSVCCDPGRFAFKESRLHLKNFPVRKFEEQTYVILFLELGFRGTAEVFGTGLGGPRCRLSTQVP